MTSWHYKGVAVGDLELDEFRVTGQNTAARLGLVLGSVTENPPVYGGVQITDNQSALLTQCTPGFTTYEKLDDIKMQHELEVMNVKVRREITISLRYLISLKSFKFRCMEILIK